jgi:hypothetical protein
MITAAEAAKKLIEVLVVTSFIRPMDWLNNLIIRFVLSLFAFLTTAKGRLEEGIPIPSCRHSAVECLADVFFLFGPPLQAAEIHGFKRHLMR